MHPVPPGLDGPTHEQEQPDGIPALPYQIGADAQGNPCVILRYEISPAERAAIARGDDLFVTMFLDDRPLPYAALHVRSPIIGERVEAGPCPEVLETEHGETIVHSNPSETPAWHVDVIGGPLDGTVMTSEDLLRLFLAGELANYGITKVEDWSRGVEHFRLLHKDELRRLDLLKDEDEDDDEDEGDEWKRTQR